MTLDRWQTFSLAEQLGHIGSEIGRARSCQEKNEPIYFKQAMKRAFALLALTIDSYVKEPRVRELTRLREVLADQLLGTGQYGITLRELETYHNQLMLSRLVHRLA